MGMNELQLVFTERSLISETPVWVGQGCSVAVRGQLLCNAGQASAHNLYLLVLPGICTARDKNPVYQWCEKHSYITTAPFLQINMRLEVVAWCGYARSCVQSV